ncbi:MAG: T9SS type A sorting domain-containing protein [Bacteroidota bacterium]
MKTTTTLIATLFAIVSVLSAQTVVPVSPGNGTLNTAIEDYVNNTGEPDLDVIFELEDGGFYVLTSSIENEFPLHIRAAQGSMQRPVIRPGVPTGGDSFRAFRVRDDLIVDGLYITNQDPLGGIESQILRISAENARVVINNCHLDKASQSALRLDNNGNRIFITNSVISNIVNESNPTNGRGIDDRGNDIDSLVIEFTTIYNLSSRILRDDGGVINYIKYNQNTSYNTGDRTLDMGEVSDEAEITNNLFVNTAFFGDDEPGSSSFQIDASDDTTEQVLIANNGFFNATGLQTTYDVLNQTAEADDRDSIFPKVFLNGDSEFFVAREMTEATIYEFLDFSFEDAPDSPTDFISTFFTDPDNVVGFDDGNGGANMDSDGQLPFDFTYSTDHPAYTGGDEGQPLGNLNSFGLGPLSLDRQLISRLAVQVFPNPAFEVANIAFNLPAAANVNLQLFNAMGQPVGAAIRGQYPAGEHRLPLVVSSLPVGAYYFRMDVDGRFGSGRIWVNR